MQNTQEYGIYNPDEYLSFLGLARNPFPVAPDNTDFYVSQHNEAIIKKLTQAVFSRRGFMLLTGEIGLGKTTISRRIIDILEQNHVHTCLILQSFYQEAGLLKEIVRDFGINVEEIRNDVSILMKLLNDFLLKQNAQGVNCAILIDDAQNLSSESLELVRMISNFEADREKLVQIILVGQPELMTKLNSSELRQLKSRVSINQTHEPLEKAEIGKYIQFKLNRAGDPGKITVEDKVFNKIYNLTKGNLRNLNIIMDHALQYAYYERSFTITVSYIKKAYKELLDANSEFKKAHRSYLVLLGMILFIIGLAAGTSIFYYSNNKGIQIAQKNIAGPVDLPNKQDIGLPYTKEQNFDFQPEEAAETQNISVPLVSESIKSFLASYGLESYCSEFQTALNEKKLSLLQQKIFDQTGYQLIRLEILPETIKQKYDILSGYNQDSKQQEYYLFWKPWLKIVKFYSGYRGEEITDLQKLLAHMGIYDYNIDGIVGQIIMDSVKNFQKKNDLNVTGFPDSETVFLLANAVN